METKLLEGVLFAAAKPMSYEVLSDVFDVPIAEIKHQVIELNKKLALRDAGITVREVENNIELVTVPECGQYIEKIRTREENLSKASLETLAIVAFKQPITKTEVEELRGVNCERILKQLQAKGLIVDLGRKEVVGRPILYGTSETFLRSVGAASLDELKSEFDEIDTTSISIEMATLFEE